MNSLQQEYSSCPLCTGNSSLLLGSADCRSYANWHEPLPHTLDWMRCSKCNHVYTRYYWSQKGLEEVFRNAHPSQLAGEIGTVDAKRITWAPVVGKVLDLLGGYRSVMPYVLI